MVPPETTLKRHHEPIATVAVGLGLESKAGGASFALEDSSRYQVQVNPRTREPKTVDQPLPSEPVGTPERTRRMRFTFPSGATPLAGYTIKRGLGIGGFGEVYFALSDSGKEVALKRIARNLEVELRGVRQCLNLKHPNLIDLWDIQLDDHGESWVVMEFVSGPSLKDVVSDHSAGLKAEDVAWWFSGIAAGVHYLHQNGIVHRDLKPGNIFHDVEADLVKIGDYGLSKFISCSRRSGHTESVGTVHYMAPEIGRGVYGREIDIYSLGIMLHELLTGRLPFDGESSQEIIMKHLTATPDVAHLAAPFGKVVLKALAKDPEQRYRSVIDLLVDLPETYWPASLKRIHRQKLDDTASHPGVSPASSASAGQTQEPVGATNVPLPAVVTTGSITALTPSANQTESMPAGESPVSEVARSDAERNPGFQPRTVPALGRHRFNQPPAPVSPTTAPSNSTPVVANEPMGKWPAPRMSVEPPSTTSLHDRFSRSTAEIVFGEVQFHDVVEAEMVFTEPTTTLLPDSASPREAISPGPDYAAKHAAALAQLPPRSDEPLTIAERRRLATDTRVQTATVHYLQQVSGADQLANILTSMLISAGVSAIVAIAGFYFLAGDSASVLPSTREDLLAIMIWLWVCCFGSVWVLLSVSRLWVAADQQTGWRRWTMVPLAMGIAGFAWGSAQGLQVDFSAVLMHHNFFDQGALGSLLFDEHQPNLWAFTVFFVGLIMLGGWSRQVNPLRAKRFRWLSLLRVSGLCCLFACLLNFDWAIALYMGVALSASAQWSAPCFTDRQRRELRDLAARSV